MSTRPVRRVPANSGDNLDAVEERALTNQSRTHLLEGEIKDQRLTIAPYPKLGEYTTWEPFRQTIETSD